MYISWNVIYKFFSPSPNIFVRKILTSFVVSFLLCTFFANGEQKMPNLPLHTIVKAPKL